MGDDDDVTHGDDVGPEDSTTDIEWTVINPHTQLSCLYQILHYQMFNGAKKDACQRLIISEHDLTTSISLIFAAVFFTLISDEKHISRTHLLDN